MDTGEEGRGPKRLVWPPYLVGPQDMEGTFEES